MMADDEPTLLQIEFETADNSSIAAPASVSASQGPNYGPMLIVLVAVVALFAAFIWFDSGSDSTAAPEELAEDTADAEADELVGGGDFDGEDATNGQFVIPEFSAATIAVEGERLENARRRAFAFDGGLLSLDELGRSSELMAPPISRFTGGDAWEEMETEAVVAGTPNNVEYFWTTARPIGGGLVVTALDFDVLSDVFVSEDAIVWERLPIEDLVADGEVSFEPLAITDDSIVGLRISSSEVLARLLGDHTNFTDVGEVCFIDGRTVFSCDGRTQFSVDEETIDSELGVEAVLRCVDNLQPVGPDLSLSAVDRASFAVVGTDERFFPGTSAPTRLNDGRIAGVEPFEVSSAPLACDGIVAVEALNAGVFVFDPSQGSTERFDLDPRLVDANVEDVGGVELAGFTGMLVRADDRFWVLDLGSGEWTLLTGVASGDQYVMSDSGTRLYSMDGADLLVLDLVLIDGRPEIVETRLFVAVPLSLTDSLDSTPFIQAATDERVTINFETGYWLVDVPAGLECAEQLADAVNGSGLIEGC